MPEPEEERSPSLRERAEQIIAELAKRGEVRTKDIQKAVQEVTERSARDRRELFGLIQKEFKRLADERRKPDPEDD